MCNKRLVYLELSKENVFATQIFELCIVKCDRSHSVFISAQQVTSLGVCCTKHWQSTVPLESSLHHWVLSVWNQTFGISKYLVRHIYKQSRYCIIQWCTLYYTGSYVATCTYVLLKCLDITALVKSFNLFLKKPFVDIDMYTQKVLDKMVGDIVITIVSEILKLCTLIEHSKYSYYH